MAKSAGIISLGISASRVLGFIRDIIIAAMFGTTMYADAFFTAFRIPNLWRDLVGEGAANAAFVPVLTEYASNKSKAEFWELARIILNVMLIVLAVITVLGIIFAPLIVSAIAWGFLGNPEKFRLTVTLTRMMFPYIFLIGLTAYATGVLNSLKLFGAASFSQPLWNLVFILSAVFLCPVMKVPVMGLVIGVLAGGVLQLLVQVPQLMGRGLGLPRFNRFRHPASTEIGKLLLPRAIASSVYQLNVMFDTAMASLSGIAGEGAIMAIYYSNRLWQLPLAIFSTAISQAMLPTLSEHAAQKDMEKFKDTLSFSLRSVFFITIPAAVGLIVLSEPIVRTLFQRGAFDEYSTKVTSSALLYFSIGLCTYAGVKVLTSAFYSLRDTRTPLKNSFMAFLLNAVLNVILMFPMKLAGLALATSISGINTFLILFLILKNRLKNFDSKLVFMSFIRILAASIFMGIVCFLLSQRNIFPGAHMLYRALNLILAICIGILSYVLFCFIFRVTEMQEFWRWVLKKGLSPKGTATDF